MIPAPRRSAVPGWSRRVLGGVLVGFLSEKLNPGADYLDLHGPDIRGLSAELNANGNVDALVHLWRSGDVEAAIKVIAFHVQVHALGDSLLTVVNDYLVHGCVGSGSKTHQGGPTRLLAPSTTVGVGMGKWTQVFCPLDPSIRTKGPVGRTDVTRFEYSTCMLVPCTQDRPFRFDMRYQIAAVDTLEAVSDNGERPMRI